VGSYWHRSSVDVDVSHTTARDREDVMSGLVTRILVPTDFSEPSNAALEYATTLAEALGASLTLVHVFEDPYLTGGALAGAMYVPVPPDLRKSMLAESRQRLNESVARLDPRFHASGELCLGPTSTAIVDYARGGGIDLIVMGTHGRGGMAHLLMGSVAERVVRTASCPVLTVRTLPTRTAAAA
jgi:universal stress protein A